MIKDDGNVPEENGDDVNYSLAQLINIIETPQASMPMQQMSNQNENLKKVKINQPLQKESIILEEREGVLAAGKGSNISISQRYKNLRQQKRPYTKFS